MLDAVEENPSNFLGKIAAEMRVNNANVIGILDDAVKVCMPLNGDEKRLEDRSVNVYGLTCRNSED